MNYEAVIGLELHIQLATNSKLFSPAPASFGAEPNSQTNEIDLGYPGVLPVLNEKAVEYAVLFGTALGAHINKNAYFMRKNYFYPDLPKGYQISQLEESIIQGGQVKLTVAGQERVVRINRGQLEEDAGKSVHDHFPGETGIDLNRAGVPLIELVSEPDLHSAAEAVEYMRTMHHLVRYLNISDGNMQEGSFRCDANVSIRPQGSQELNARVELKNINSFRFVEQAINLEIQRQIELVESGQPVAQETRLFDADAMETRTMRSKENANDYRYFPDPDLLPLNLQDDWLQGILARLPELPEARRARYQKDFALDGDGANYLVQSQELADYFDAVVAAGGDGKLAANWIQGELARLLNQSNLTIGASPVAATALAEILRLVKANEISAGGGRKILQRLWEEPGQPVAALVDALGLRQVNDDGQIEGWVAEIIAANPQQVQDYKNGQTKMLGFLTGQVIKLSKGQANPKTVNELLKAKLDG